MSKDFGTMRQTEEGLRMLLILKGPINWEVSHTFCLGW